MAVLGVSAMLAQTLGDIAKQEEARRKTIAKPGKVYTNDSLRGDPTPSTATSPDKPPSDKAPTDKSAPDKATADKTGTDKAAAPDHSGADESSGKSADAKTESDWQNKIKTARDNLARAQTFAEALQTRINVLTADFVNRADPAQRAAIGADRQKALGELNRVKTEITQDKKAIDDIQDEARRAGVPPGWLR
jgi:hypothetical protein